MQADQFLIKHGENPHREDLNELDHKETVPNPNKLASSLNEASKDRVRLVRLLEGVAPTAIMASWHSLSEDLQNGILENLVLTLEQEAAPDKEKLIQRFEYLVKETEKFIKKETWPPIDAYMGKRIPVEDLKLQREISAHASDNRLGLAELIAKFEQPDSGNKSRLQ